MKLENVLLRVADDITQAHFIDDLKHTSWGKHGRGRGRVGAGMHTCAE